MNTGWVRHSFFCEISIFGVIYNWSSLCLQNTQPFIDCDIYLYIYNIVISLCVNFVALFVPQDGDCLCVHGGKAAPYCVDQRTIY